MGVLASRFTHARPSAQPPHRRDTSENLKNFKKYSDHFFAISGNSKHFLKKTKKFGVPQFFYRNSHFTCYLKPHSKFLNPMIIPFWRKVYGSLGYIA
jgi:hypothetical protein